MKRYFARKGDEYINYLSLFTSDPFKLSNTKDDRIWDELKSFRKRKHIVYTEEEAIQLLRIEENIELLEVT